jgi:hypothetical protein
MESIDKKFQDQVNKGEDLTDLEKSNLNTFLELVISRLGKIDQVLKPLPLMSSEDLASRVSYERDDKKSNLIELEKLLEEGKVTLEQLEAIVRGELVELFKYDSEDKLSRDSEGDIILTKEDLKELAKKANRPNNKVSSKKAVIEKEGAVSLKDPEKIKKQPLNNKSSKKVNLKNKSKTSKDTFNKNIKKKINSTNKNSLTKKVKGSVEIIKKNKINKNNPKEKTSSEKKSTIEEVKEKNIPIEAFEINNDWILSKGFALLNEIYIKGLLELKSSDIASINYLSKKVSESYPDYIKYNLIEYPKDLNNTIGNLKKEKEYTNSLLGQILALIFKINFKENFTGNFNSGNYYEKNIISFYSFNNVDNGRNTIFPRIKRGDFFPTVETITLELQGKEKYPYNYIFFKEEGLSEGYRVFLEEELIETNFPTINNTRDFSGEWFRLAKINEVNEVIEVENNLEEITYNDIIEKVIEKANKLIEETKSFEYPLGLTQIFNSSEERAINNLQLLVDFSVENGWNDYKKDLSNEIVVLSEENKQELYENYPDEINVWFNGELPEGNLYAFELSFNWCGHGVGYLFKDYLKKEIRKKYLPSTYRMFRAYGKQQDRIQKFDLNNPPIDNYKKPELVNNRAYIISYEYYWMSYQAQTIWNRIDTSLPNAEELIIRVLDAYKEIFNKLLKRGDIISCLPAKGKPYGSHFALITGEVFYDFNIDSKEIFFEVPVIESNFTSSLVAGSRDLQDVQIRYRFKPEDFNNFIEEKQFAKDNSKKDLIYYKVRNT